MAEIFGLLPQLADLIQKAGVVGLMLIVCGVLVYEIRRSRKHLHDIRGELGAVYHERDTLALCVVKLKTVCEQNKIRVDLADVQGLLQKAHAIQ